MAARLADEGAGHGEVVLASAQSAGRGRLGKTWSSPAGKGLYFTIILRPQRLKLENYPHITLAAGVAVAEALEKNCSIRPQLKWPNDVYIGGRKCCGILAESAPIRGEKIAHVILGIGLNVLTPREDFPDDVIKRATSIYVETGELFDLETLFSAIYQDVMEKVACLEREGFAQILLEWKRRDFLLGKRLQWVTNKNTVIEGISEGPEADGEFAGSR